MAEKIKIEYCVQCGWLLRSGWLAQELLSTVGRKIGEVALVPSSGGVFKVFVGADLIWSREDKSAFPSAAELKTLVRDRIAPHMRLGHMDGETKSRELSVSAKFSLPREASKGETFVTMESETVKVANLPSRKNRTGKPNQPEDD